MQENIVLPQGLSKAIGPEKRLFVVKAGRIEPKRSSFIKIGCGIISLLITFSICFFVFQFSIAPNITHIAGGDVSIRMNDSAMDTVFSGLIGGGLFLLVGIYLITKGVLAFVGDGGTYAGTSTRLWHFYRGRIRTHEWRQFLEPRIDSQNDGWTGTVILPLKSFPGAKNNGKNNALTQNKISLCEVNNAYEIERICRKKIKEASLT